MFTEGAKEIVTNQMHVRIPNAYIKRDQWINLCIDLQSIVKECFSHKSPATEKAGGGPRTNSRGNVESRGTNNKKNSNHDPS